MKILLIVFLCYIVHSSDYAYAKPRKSPPRKAKSVLPLSVNGSQVLIGGKPGSLAGCSFFWSNTKWGGEKFFNAKVVKWLKSDWKATIIRAPLGVEAQGGYVQEPQKNKARVITVVNAAIAEGMYAIVDWHSHECKQHTAKAVAFFKEMAKKYCHVNNVIYEILNEPKLVSWKRDIKPYALAVIRAIRAIDKTNLIIVGTAKWSQEVQEAAADPIKGFINIAYTLHFYTASHGEELRQKALKAMKKKIALFVTEWGTVNADGNGNVAIKETNAWVSFMKRHKLSNCNWSINDKAEGASALKPGASPNGGWPQSQLTESGKYVRNMIRTWPK